MPLDNRDCIRGNHPLTCTCTECVRIRLQRIRHTKSFDPRFHSDGTPDRRFISTKANKVPKEEQYKTMNKTTTPNWPMNQSKMWPKNKWLLRHLNWTLVLYWLLGIPISWVVTILYTITESEVVFTSWSIAGFGWFVGLWYLVIWNLKHRGRSVWNLLYLFIPLGIGIIIFLFIRDQEQLVKDAAMMEKVREHM